MPSNSKRTSGSGHQDPTAPHIARDAKTGRYIVQRSAEGSTSSGKPKTKKQRPDTFIENFTKHPLVDRVMKRLSR